MVNQLLFIIVYIGISRIYFVLKNKHIWYNIDGEGLRELVSLSTPLRMLVSRVTAFKLYTT